jgi:hypothetical protein
MQHRARVPAHTGQLLSLRASQMRATGWASGGSPQRAHPLHETIAPLALLLAPGRRHAHARGWTMHHRLEHLVVGKSRDR